MLKIKLNDHCFVVLEEIESRMQRHEDKRTTWDFQGVTLNKSQTENSPEDCFQIHQEDEFDLKICQF